MWECIGVGFVMCGCFANMCTCRRRKNQRMTQVKMFIHFRLTQHVSGIIMPIVRRQTE